MKKVIYCSQVKRLIEEMEEGRSYADVMEDRKREREKTQEKDAKKFGKHLYEWKVKYFDTEDSIVTDIVVSEDENDAKAKIVEMLGRDVEVYSIERIKDLGMVKECYHVGRNRYILSSKACGSIYGTDDSIYLHKAKQCITDYIYYEFDGEPDFGDLSHIEVAYTTEENPITGKESEIQTYVDLINFEIVTEIDGVVVNTIKYNTLNEFIDNELQWLDFDSLVRTDDEMWDIVNRR